jgi:hypothetical protein
MRETKGSGGQTYSTKVLHLCCQADPFRTLHLFGEEVEKFPPLSRFVPAISSKPPLALSFRTHRSGASPGG